MMMCNNEARATAMHKRMVIAIIIGAAAIILGIILLAVGVQLSHFALIPIGALLLGFGLVSLCVAYGYWRCYWELTKHRSHEWGDRIVGFGSPHNGPQINGCSPQSVEMQVNGCSPHSVETQVDGCSPHSVDKPQDSTRNQGPTPTAPPDHPAPHTAEGASGPEVPSTDEGQNTPEDNTLEKGNPPEPSASTPPDVPPYAPPSYDEATKA